MASAKVINKLAARKKGLNVICHSGEGVFSASGIDIFLSKSNQTVLYISYTMVG